MTHSIVSLSTATTSASLRSEYWAQALGTLCGRLRVDPFGAGTIDGHIDYATIRQLRLCQIEVSQHRIAHPASCPEPGRPVKVLFQTCGTSLFGQDGRHLVIAPGDCLIYDVSRPHVITSSALTKHHVVIIPRQLVEQRGVPLDPLLAQQVSAREGAGRLAHDFVLSAFREAPALAAGCELQVADTLLDLVLMPFFSETPFRGSGRAALSSRIKAFIRENLSDPDLGIEQLSAALDCTKRYLHMSFADEGTTITSYIWQKRLEKCLEELEFGPRPGMTLTDIAFSWGFSSSSHFTHLFKKRYGMPPSAIQRHAGAPARFGLARPADPGRVANGPDADRKRDPLSAA
ncbi:putative Transcriptional regulatory protein AraC/XylS family protein [Bosea sp. LC85]|uniref:AraC-like ligand-binding domain-containing protein n=1 Tax=Bosea sp. LC85 TaxID=1502851 RepID=UPI0004E43769|nr:helix-turn-helix domain-containing protein [Bosea sp. LC85]KFC64735.1 putative Transcriptional regulatory protein AraC/XylS family protein [Bosea sp. LC85]